MLNFRLDFPMPCFNVVGCSRALSVEVNPNSMVALNPLGYDVVCKWRCVYWEVGVIQCSIMFCRPRFNRFWGLKYIPRLFSEYMLTFRIEEPMKICVTN